MNLQSLKRTFGSLLLLISPALLADEPLRTLLGNAYHPESGELMYQEHHRFEYEGKRLISAEVDYRYPDGRLIASKTLDFSRNASLPAFKTVHADERFIEGLEYRDDGLYLFNKKAGEDAASKTIEQRKDMAADAGFNNYVYERYDELASGDTVKFHFVAPNHLTSVKFKAKKIGEREIEGLPVVDFKVSISSFLSLFVDPLLLSYDPKTRHLIEYQGLSNIRDEEGELYKVRIQYPQLLPTSTAPTSPAG